MTTPTHTHTTTGPTTSATAKTYTAAMIGCGSAQRQGSKLAGGFGIGYAHAQGYAGCPRTELVAAADINAENLTAYGEQFQLDPARRFADYEQMIAEVQPDIVSIGTYVGLHYPMMEKAAKAGVKGILCEKPFVRSPKELAAVQRLVDETGVKICIAHQRRNSGVFQRAAELYNDGTVGQRLCCIAGIANWDLSEWGSHWLDMLRFFHRDEPLAWVMGQMRVRDTRSFGHAMEEHAMAWFKFDSDAGGFGLVEAGHNPVHPYSIVLQGTEGTIRIAGNNLLIDTPAGRREEQPADPDTGGGYVGLFHGFANWLDGGEVPLNGLPRAYGSAELNLATYLSAVRGDRVDLPLSEQDLQLDEWPVEIAQRRHAAGDDAVKA